MTFRLHRAFNLASQVHTHPACGIFTYAIYYVQYSNVLLRMGRFVKHDRMKLYLYGTPFRGVLWEKL